MRVKDIRWYCLYGFILFHFIFFIIVIIMLLSFCHRKSELKKSFRMENMDYVAATAVAIITKAYIERRIKENRKMMKKKREKERKRKEKRNC